MRAEPHELAASIVAAAHAHGGLLLCSDFDGTLAPIAPTPEEAHPIESARAPLAWMSREGAAAGEGGVVPVQLAIITSRDVGDLVDHIGLGPEAVVIGCSGLERWTDGHVVVDRRVEPWLPALASATEELADSLAAERVPGARLERKRCASVIHTRGLRDEADDQALELVESVAGRAGLAVARGKRAVELRPPVRVDKSDAVASLRVGRWADVALCVAGDDRPDVPMLRLAATDAAGTAVAVADAESPAEVVAAADVSIEGPPAWGLVLAETALLLAAG